MPAQLPPTSGYTYALDLSVDEAPGQEVQFNKPVIIYIENFLNFPVGDIVPTGSYDRVKAAWIPSSDGRVVKILSITGSMADVDTNGDGVVDDAGDLAALGVTDSERQELATRYSAGQSLWRVPITHFSDNDMNWPVGLPGTPVRLRCPRRSLMSNWMIRIPSVTPSSKSRIKFWANQWAL
jgi:hypothetical protein